MICENDAGKGPPVSPPLPPVLHSSLPLLISRSPTRRASAVQHHVLRRPTA